MSGMKPVHGHAVPTPDQPQQALDPECDAGPELASLLVLCRVQVPEQAPHVAHVPGPICKASSEQSACASWVNLRPKVSTRATQALTLLI